MDEMDDFFAMDSLASAVASVAVSGRTASSTVNSDFQTGAAGLESEMAAIVDDGRPCEWTAEEAKLVGPCLTLIRVSSSASSKCTCMSSTKGLTE